MQQLAGIDSVLVINAQDLSLSVEGEHDGLRFTPAQFDNEFLFLTAMTFESQLIQSLLNL
jgi:hypothetical protein